MYLSGSKWSMRKKRRRRSRPGWIFILIVMISGVVYINQIVVPVTPPLFIPTPTPTRDPESFVNEAVSYFNEGKLSKAIDSYKQAILTDPVNPSNYVNLARVQILAGQYNAHTQQSPGQQRPTQPIFSQIWAIRGEPS